MIKKYNLNFGKILIFPDIKFNERNFTAPHPCKTERVSMVFHHHVEKYVTKTHNADMMTSIP